MTFFIIVTLSQSKGLTVFFELEVNVLRQEKCAYKKSVLKSSFYLGFNLPYLSFEEPGQGGKEFIIRISAL